VICAAPSSVPFASGTTSNMLKRPSFTFELEVALLESMGRLLAGLMDAAAHFKSAPAGQVHLLHCALSMRGYGSFDSIG